MRFGIPREDRVCARERRVPLTPEAARALHAEGHELLVEEGAGLGAGFTDAAWARAGARIVASRQEIFTEAELVVCLSRPVEADLPSLRPGLPVLALHRLERAPRALRHALAERELIAIGADRLRDERGASPVREALDELSGALAPSLAARLLASEAPGRAGLLLGALPGLPAPEVAVLGAGVLGLAAARAFAALGAPVRLLDAELGRLRALGPLPPGAATLEATPDALEESLRRAQVLVLPSPAPGLARPALDQSRLALLREGAVILDFSEGEAIPGAVEVDHPDEAARLGPAWHLALREPSRLAAGSASRLLSAALLPYVRLLGTGVTPKAHRVFAPAIYFGEALV